LRADDVRVGCADEFGGDRQAFSHRMAVPGRIAQIEAHDREIAHATILSRAPPGREHLCADSESAGKSWKNGSSGLSGDLICRRKGVHVTSGEQGSIRADFTVRHLTR